MGAIDLSFNPQFNCLIGGRGTGKSTILEYLRWGLCDQPPITSTNDEIADLHAKRSSLIENTLAPLKAVITVVFTVNGVRHVVRRKTDGQEIQLKVGDEAFRSVKEQNIRELLPLQAFSQKQLSAVGVRAEELLRFIEAPVSRQLDDLRSLAEDKVAILRSTYAKVLRKNKINSEVARFEVEHASLEKQIVALRKGLKGLSEQDQSTLRLHDFYSAEQSAFEQWQRNADTLAESIRRIRSESSLTPTRSRAGESSPNADLLKTSEVLVASIFETVRLRLAEAEQLLTDASAQWRQLSEMRRDWQSRRDSHESLYEAVKQQAIEHESLITQIAEIDNRIKVLRDTITDRKSSSLVYGDLETELESTKEEWINILEQRTELLANRCNDLNRLSGGMIRATIRRGAGVRQLAGKFSAILEGTNIRAQAKKIDDLCASISRGTNSIRQWEKVIQEVEALATVDFEDSSSPNLPNTPNLSNSGFTKQDSEKMARKLKPEDWLELALIEIDDVPKLEYRQREGEYINFADASAGQQATALLRVLLHQEGPPLLIDQPEEDLDNQVILQIVEDIWESKKQRQIIFSSHNANIVVNGDADLVVVCDYRTSGDQSGGKIKCQGAIDIEEIRKEITIVMEGGKDAFRMRKEKYGF